MGQMMPAVDAALAQDFVVYQAGSENLASVVSQFGGVIRGIATRGRQRTDAALIAALPKLEVISNFGVGYDSIDLAAAMARGIIVTNTPDVLNEEVADFTVGLVLSTIRELPQADRFLRDGKWLKGAYPLTQTLRDRTIGMVGMGRIGRAIAKRIAAFGVPIVYHSRKPQDGVDYRHYPDLKTMASDVDTLIAVVPGGAATKHMIDAGIFAALGPRGILINVARGSVVDQNALIDALRDGIIHGAGLDVFADEPNVPLALLVLPNVVLVPHIGSGTHHTRAVMGELVVDNLRSWFAGKGPLTPVAETPWPKTCKTKSA
ncbi:MAG: 2-hydroxyacid dehydrogenase [Xanthobacteraceae bacterium]|nr:2-hydroxyacid dehydrogenase [Xanthobacteraceae bacterium]